MRLEKSSVEFPAKFMIICHHFRGKVLFLAIVFSWLMGAAPMLAYDAIYAFGDSLTDTGNDPAPGTNYFQGRYSNGALWIEYLSTRLGLTYNPSNNFAESGGETSNALAQVQQLIVPTNASQSLFVVWAGGNDFIHNFGQGINDVFWTGLITQSVRNLSNSVVQLYAGGARTIMVPNQVDLSRIPLVLGSGYPTFVFAYLSNKVSQFNAGLAGALTAIATAKPDLQLIRPDVYTRFSEVLGNLAGHGFTKANPDALTDPALADKSFTGPGQDYVFWDDIHPTTKAHALVAGWFYEALPRPRLEITVSGDRLQLNLTQLGQGQVYTVQESDGLSGWRDLATISATNSVQQWTIPLGPAMRSFFRLKQ
jgi:phospholipase/lecithinase/hemolysin